MLKPRPIYCPNVILLHSENNEVFPIEESKNIIEKVTTGRKVITVIIHNEYDDIEESQIVVKNPDYVIYKELRKKSGNVASDLLAVGSDYVYYIKADEENYRAAFIHVYDILSNDFPIICITNYLADQLKAGGIIISDNSNQEYITSFAKKLYYPELLFTTSIFIQKTFQFTENKVVIN